MRILFLMLGAMFLTVHAGFAQTPAKLVFCDRSYKYGIGNDSIRLYFNLLNGSGARMTDVSPAQIEQMATFLEDGKPIASPRIRTLTTGVRMPQSYTFSILLDRSIPTEGKRLILSSIKDFVEMAPDSCVYISFYGDEVSNTIMASKSDFAKIESAYMTPSEGKMFYSGIQAKLSEFSAVTPDFLSDVAATGYTPNPLIASRAAANPGKNYLMVFAEGSRLPDAEVLDFMTVTDYQRDNVATLPRVYSFYYIADGEDAAIYQTLDLLSSPRDSNSDVIADMAGKVMESADMDEVTASFLTVVKDAMYDYELVYRATPDKIYAGNVEYSAKWGNKEIGEAMFTIGSAERPWPEHKQTTTSLVIEMAVALLVTVLTFLFFFLVMKIAVPFVRSLMFKSRYYRKYQPEDNVQRRICHYCKQDLRPGQVIVAKCKHYMHKHCWEENGYKCAEYGQNCKDGIQEHVSWRDLFRLSSLRDCSQTIAGVLAGLLSWIIYELCGRGGFGSVSEFIVSLGFDSKGAQASLLGDCVSRTSSFLMIGLLLGFFISLVFRYKDEIRDKTWKVWLKIIGLSCLSAIVGMASFAVGAYLFCVILSAVGTTYIPWYCSLPAYVLFSICVSLALTIKSSIPVRSALWGGLLSAVIGFLVLYFTRFTSSDNAWLNMLLDFIIYGGGLGASLVTVRMLAERYFLVIQNGVKAGQRIPIHKWMNATGGGNKVSIGITGECEIQMNWEKSNKVAKEHAQLYIDHDKMLPVIKPLATGVVYNSRAELPVNRPAVLSNGDTFKIGDTIFKYEEA